MSHLVASWDQALDVDCHQWAPKMPGITGFSILEEQMDEKYEPTEQEIRDYAEWLGIAEEDTELLWIARQGLKTPLPKPWRPCEASSGEIFFYNPVTGASQWDHPCDEELRQLYLQEKTKKHRKGPEDQKEQNAEREAQEKDCKDGKEETTSVSSIGEEVEEKTPPPSCETKKSKASMIDEAQSTQKRLSFASESSGSAPSSPVGQEAPDAPAQHATKKASELKKLIPERPNKPPPAKLRPPRPKTDRDLEDAFCKSPSPARSRRQSPERPAVQSPPSRSKQSPEHQGGYATPSPPSPPTPGLSAVLKAEVRDDDISFWSNLENGEETLCQVVSKCSENSGSLEISSLTAVLEPSNSGENEGTSGKASPGDAEAGGSVPHTTLASLQCSLTALEPSSSDNPSGLSTRADPEVGTDGVLHSKTSLVELAEVSAGKENQKPCNVIGSRPLKDITNEIRDAKLPTTPRSLASSAVDVAAMQRLQWELKEEQEERAVLDRQLAEALTAASMEQLAHSSTKAALRNSQRDVQRLETQLRFKDSEVEHLEAELQKCQSELAMLTAEKKQAETQLKAQQAELTRCKSKPQKKPSKLPSPKESLNFKSDERSSEPAEFLQRRRRELRQQHAELEEERKQWRQEAQNCGGTEPNEDLVRTRVVLDARAITLNKKISEYRALQRALTSGALHSPNA